MRLSRARVRRFAVVALALAVAGCRIGLRALPASGALDQALAQTAARPDTVDSTTIRDKLLFGYQGWFGCPDDGSPLGAWEHWFQRGAPAGAATLRVDMWPDVAELGPDER